ncbi:MAG: Ig-like domain-containing protein, partial [Phycisphaerales bacterium]
MTNNGNGTWTLPGTAFTTPLPFGVYDITVTVAVLDSAGNLGLVQVSLAMNINETLVFDLASTRCLQPTALRNSPVPSKIRPPPSPSGINGTPYAATNNGDGTWTLADNTITVPLADGVYDVLAQGTIAGPVTLADDTTNELTIDTTAPVVTVNPLNTSDTTPQLTGTVNETTAVVSVTVNGNVYAATNNGDGTWTLADNTISPALPVNTYNVQVSATDAVGNVGSDATTDELIVTAPIIPSIDLDDLHAANGGDGTEGTVFNGVAGGDWAGNSASSAGEINGDGFDDLVIGANNADPLDNNDGTVYIVFGRADGFPAEFDLSTLDGTNGFKINAQVSRDSLGVSVASAGDVNGDGIDDLVIGADLADPGGNRSGTAYVIYGKTSPFTATFDLSTLNGTNGYKFNGAATDDRTGFSVNTAGDINGDGLADVVIGTTAADNGVVIDTGRAYVIYGSSAAMPAVLTVGALNGTNGFILTGPDADGQTGFSVSSAGDMNGDGIADLRIGSPGATVGSDAGAGKTFVVFGNTAGFGTELNLSTLNGTNGFVIEGNAADMGLGFSGSAIGDVNGDGFADLLVSAPASADPASAGSAFVIFGHAGAFPATLSVGSLNGTNGFALLGVDAGDETGFNVSGIGDVNGDGYDDLLVSAHMAAGGTFENGETYLLFGRAGAFSAAIDLSTIPGNGGIVINGANVLDHAGRYVSMAGDVNGDGYADFLVAARDADVNGNNDAGRTYLIYGRDFSGTVTQAGGATGTTLTGTAARDAIIAGAGDDTVVGNGGPDIQSGGQGDDTLAISDTAFKRLSGGNG